MHGRVEKNTANEINERLKEETEDRIKCYSLRSKEDLDKRINELEQEWDIERFLEVNASTFAFTGLALGLLKSKKWFVLPGLVLPFLFLHGNQGWCPPLPVFRKLGIRTKREIEEERYALKTLRGDFKDLNDSSEETDRLELAVKVIDAVRK